MRKVGLTFVVAATLSACGPQSLPLNDPSAVSKFRSVEHSFNASNITVRSFVKDEDGNSVEVSGAVCSARNSLVGFSKVATPAQMNLPTYLQAERFPDRGKPPVLKGTCRYQGKTLEFRAEPTSLAYNVSTTSGGYYDASTGVYTQPTTTRLVGRLSPTLPWKYPSIRVEFE